jgi:hypothetical protein
MRYLLASLVKQRNIIIDKARIVKTIFDFKSTIKPELLYLFDDIEFREGIDNVVSADIDASINNLQTFGVLGKFNPTYEKMLIFLTEQEADEILSSCESDVRAEINKLALSFER